MNVKLPPVPALPPAPFVICPLRGRPVMLRHHVLIPENVNHLLIVHRQIQQSGFLRLLIYLSNKKEKTLTETDIPVNQLYASVGKAKELGLVKARVDKGKYPPRNIIEITGKGKKVTLKIDEVLRLIK